jgi:hypothetical protein
MISDKLKEVAEASKRDLQKLNSDIYSLINKFTEDTGLYIDNITLTSKDFTNGDHKLIRVNCQIKNPFSNER